MKRLCDKLRRAHIALPIALLGVLASSHATESEYDPKLLSMLPPYCIYTQIYRNKVAGGADATQIERWDRVMGHQNFIHMHHYCWGLENTIRALYFSSTKLERDRELAYAVVEFDYVVQRVAPDFVLLPEILAKRGENLLRLGNGAKGILDLTRAIDLKPDHWPPYAALSDYYKALGDFSLARDWAEKGLAAAPGTRGLQRRLAELDKPRARATPSTN